MFEFLLNGVSLAIKGKPYNFQIEISITSYIILIHSRCVSHNLVAIPRICRAGGNGAIDTHLKNLGRFKSKTC